MAMSWLEALGPASTVRTGARRGPPNFPERFCVEAVPIRRAHDKRKAVFESLETLLVEMLVLSAEGHVAMRRGTRLAAVACLSLHEVRDSQVWIGPAGGSTEAFLPGQARDVPAPQDRAAILLDAAMCKYRQDRPVCTLAGRLMDRVFPCRLFRDRHLHVRARLKRPIARHEMLSRRIEMLNRLDTFLQDVRFSKTLVDFALDGTAMPQVP